jgi:hypothetical protein
MMMEAELAMAKTEMQLTMALNGKQLEFEYDTKESITNLEAVMETLIAEYNELI